ncbi:MAG TPA: hypothetical protein VI356_12610 [Myxococcales bacterium]
MEWFEQAVEKARDRAKVRVAELRVSHPNEDQVALGRRLVSSSALRAGLAGAASGSLSLIALPLGLPAAMAVTLFVEAELIFALLELYELDTAGDAGRLKLYTLWAGAGFAGAAKSAGLRTGARAVARILEGSVPVRIIRRLNPALIKAILRRLGLGWLPRTARLWPLIGAPVSFVLDRAALRALGNATLATLDDEARERRRRARPRPRAVKVTVS